MNHSFADQETLIRQTAAVSTDPMPLEDLVLVRGMTHFTQLYKEHRTTLLRQFSLNETQFLAFVMIYYQPNHAVQPSHLSGMLGSSRTNITRVSDELEKKGWIERCMMKEDRRAFLLKVTPEGKEFLEKFLPNQWELIERIFSVLSEDEHQALLKILRKLNAHLDEQEYYIK